MEDEKYNGDKSYVGMANCFICGEAKHLLLDRRLKNSLPQSAIYDKEPCDKCKEIMEQGVLFIGVRDGEQESDNPYLTGQIIGIKEEAVKNMPINEELKKDILKRRACFIEEAVLKSFGLITETGELKYKKERV